jgi:hypothetical protein
MFVEPIVTLVANPPAAIVAISGSALDQVTVPVMSAVLLSTNVPVAVNCCVLPRLIAGFNGVTDMETRLFGTVSVTDTVSSR